MARLYSVSPPGAINLQMNKEMIKVGRLPDNDLVLNDALISRKHCEFRREQGRWKLVDLSSLNGVFVNNLRVTDTVLASGDVVQIGNFKMVFEETMEGASSGIQYGAEVIKPIKELGIELGLDAKFAEENEKLARDREARYFYILYQITRALNAANNLNEILDLSFGTGVPDHQRRARSNHAAQ